MWSVSNSCVEKCSSIYQAYVQDARRPGTKEGTGNNGESGCISADMNGDAVQNGGQASSGWF